MNRKVLGVALLIIATAIFFLAGDMSYIKAILVLLLLYNWLYGRQKGHPLHLLLIWSAFALSCISYLHYGAKVLDRNEAAGLCAILAATVFIVVVVNKNSVLGFYNDYKNGEKRDHFGNS